MHNPVSRIDELGLKILLKGMKFEKMIFRIEWGHLGNMGLFE